MFINSNWAPYDYLEKSLTQFETIVLDSHDTLEDVLIGLLEDDEEMDDNDEIDNEDQKDENDNENGNTADQTDDEENADTTNLAVK